METFKKGESIIMQGKHELGVPVSKNDSGFYSEEDKALANKLNDNDLYQITMGGKTRCVTFERWHGAHALFYSFRDDWRYALYIDDLRKLGQAEESVTELRGGCGATGLPSE